MARCELCCAAPPVAKSAVRLAVPQETLRGLPTRQVEVVTPMRAASVRRLDGAVLAVTVLHAGLGLLAAAMQQLPEASIVVLRAPA